MEFCRDVEEEGWFYVNRGIDDKADHFKPCEPCAASLRAHQDPDPARPWFKADLCGECYTWLEIISEIDESLDKRPIIYEPMRSPLILEGGVFSQGDDEPGFHDAGSSNHQLP